MRFKTAKLQAFKKALFPVLLLSVLIGLSAGPTQAATSGNSSPTQNNVLGTSLVQNTAPAPESTDTNGQAKNADQVDQPGTATLTTGPPIAGIPIIPAWQWTNITGATSAIYSPIAGNDGKNPWASVSYTENCSSGGAVTNPESNPGLLADCAILLSIKNEIAGGALLNWTSDTPIDSWDGINTGGTPERVAGINLNNRSLTGRVPKELGNLGGLETLYLSGNFLTGEIPEELGRLGNLRSLNLGGNSLAGGIPEELGELAGLTSLYLYKNTLAGEIPEELGDLSDLIYLSLQCNKLSGPIPAELGDLAALVNFQLGGNRLAQPVPPALAGIASTSNASCGSAFNSAPVFSETAPISREVPEDTTLGNSFGNPVTATDVHFGTITDDVSYSLSGIDAASFTIDPSTGQLSLNTTLDHSTKPSYSVQAKAEDDYGGEATEPITIIVTVTHGAPAVTGLTDGAGSEAQAGVVNKYWPVIATTKTLTYACDNGTAVNNPVSNPELVDDCDALLRIKDTLDTTDYLDWSVDSDIEDWEGITVEGSPKRVTKFNYRRLLTDTDRLTGSLSAEFSELDALTDIDLDSNSLTGGIPAELGSLTNLGYLHLDSNSLTGEIPEELGDLTNLTGLYLRNNGLTGEIPEELGNLSNLVHLYLGNNSLTGEIPEELGDLTSLTYLSLSKNSLTGEIPEELGDLSDLRSLYLYSNSLTGEIPAELGSLSSLTRLHLSHNSLTGEIPAELGDLTNLHILRLHRNSLTGEIPEELGNLVNLWDLRLNGNGLTGNIPEELGDLSDLQRLRLQCNKLSGPIPAELADLGTLQSFYIGGNRLTGPLPPALAGITGTSDSTCGSAFNRAPAFSETAPISREVPEDTTIGNSFGDPVTATDVHFGTITDDVSYSLSGIDAASFTLDPSTGQLSLNTTLDHSTKSSYSVQAKAEDDYGGVTTEPITLNVTVPPGAPSVTGLTRGTTRLTVNWAAPEDDGGTTINAYDLRYRQTSATDWTLVDNAWTSGDLKYEVTGLTAGTEYEAQARAVNNVGDGLWSPSATADTLTYACDNDTAVENPVDNPRLVDDCDALLRGKNTLDPDDYLDWSVDSDIEDWEGITVAGSPKRVTKFNYRGWITDEELIGSLPAEFSELDGLTWIRLEGNGLTGEIPEELGDLTNLTRLDLRINDLTGEIPEELGDLSNLTFLALDANALTGGIPEELGGLTNLTRLNLGNNSLTGEIPEELGDLTSLTYLSLNNNNLTGEIPEELGDLTNLVWLNLYSNSLTGEIPEELGDLSNLRSLFLHYNSLTGEIPEWLGDLTSLTHLYLYGNSLTGEIPEELGNLTSLTDLYLHSNSLTGEIPEELEDLTSLTRILLHSNSLTGEIPEWLGDLTGLTYLYLYKNDLTGEIPEELGSLSNLRGLYLYNNSLTGEIPEELGDLTSLTRLHLGSNGLTGGIPEELGDLTNLVWLNLYSNSLTGEIPEELGSLSNLRELQLNNNGLTGEIPEELGNLSDLTHLHLYCNKLSGPIPDELADLGDLESFYIGGNRLTGPVPPALAGIASTSSGSCGSAFNSAPAFSETAPVSREVPENTTIGNSFGDPVTATDVHFGTITDEVSYSLSGTDAASFTIDPSTGQLSLNTTLDYSTKSSYSVQAKAEDDYGGEATEPITLNVTVPPGAPSVTGLTRGTTRLTVNWAAPEDDGSTTINAYDLRYRQTSATDWTLVDNAWTSGDLKYEVTGLTAGTEYEAQARAVNNVGDGLWSPSATADTLTYACDNGAAVDNPVDNPGLVDDCDALLRIKDTLDPDDYLDWSVDSDVEDWEGITVDGSPKRVTRFIYKRFLYETDRLTGSLSEEFSELDALTYIDLAGNGLTGEIPEELSSLTNLTQLYLRNNDLTGEIPEELGDLTSLTSLQLQGNSLTGEIPEELGSLSNLTDLYLDRNGLTGGIPEELGDLTNLLALILDRNSLTGEIPEELGDLDNLRDLYLGYNSLTGEIPEELSNLTSLTNLHLGGNSLTGGIPEELGDLTSLTNLHLGGNSLTGGIPEELGDLTSLIYLHLGSNSLTGGIPAELGDLTSLRRLYLGYNSLTGGIPEELGDLTSLTNLHLGSNSLTGGIPAELGDLTSLTDLYLSSNSLTGGIPEELGDLTNLTRLQLQRNSLTGGIPEELGDLTSLRSLWLHSNSLTGEIPEELGDLTSLTYLHLDYNSLTGEIPEELGDLTSLTYLSLGSNGLTGGIPEELGDLTSLTHLHLDYNNLTGGIPEELGNLSDLTHLWLQNNDLTGVIPEELGSLPSLTWLQLGDNDLTGEIPEELGDLTSLVFLYLQCNKLSGPIPAELADLGDLQSFLIGGNRLAGPIPPALAGIASTSDSTCGSAFNSAPAFSETAPISREVPEDTTLGNSFGDPITATDVHFGTITDEVSYSLSGIDAASFTIDPSTGQLSLNTTLDYFTKPSYSVQVKAEDDYGGEATEPGTINLAAPPGAPSVTGLTRGTTRLTVNWAAPDDDGGTTSNAYDVRYRQTSAADWTVVDNAWTSGDLKYEVTGLTAGTEYEAQARAVNNVGDGLWSSSATAETLTYACDNGTAVENLVDNPELVDDCDALLRIKDTLDTTDNLDWSVDSDIEDWEGITVAGSPKRVTKFHYQRYSNYTTDRLTGSLSAEFAELDALTDIDLGGNLLTNEIPEELGSLTNLTNLSLGYNNLTGEIPEEMSNLVNLWNLQLYRNSLTGEIPEDLGDLSNLTDLSLYGNSLTGGIPEELGDLTSLTNLSLGNNGLTGEIPEELGNLSNLRGLNLGHNSLTGEIPEELGDLSNLTQLDLRYNSLTGEIPEELGDLSNLYDLVLGGNSLTGNSLTGEIPEWLGDLSSLTNLSLGPNSFTGEIPEELGSLSNLRRLYLNNNSLTGEIPEWLGDLTNLQALLLDSNSLTGEIPEELGDLSNLTNLHLNNNSLTGEIPEWLGDLSDLTRLWLQNNDLSGVIPEELGSLPSLTWLQLGDNDLTGEIPEELGDLSSLEYLSLQCNKLSGPIPTDLADLGDLVNLQLGGNRLTGPVPPALAGIASTSDASCGSAFNSAPAFSEIPPVSREVPENTPADSNIGEPVGSTDSHDDPIVYALSGTDQASFSIVAGTGQILTTAALDHETKPSYSLEVEASDPYGGESTIAITISVTEVAPNNPPAFSSPDLFDVAENTTTAGTLTAGDPDPADDITDYRITGGVDQENFELDANTGALRFNTPPDYDAPTDQESAVPEDPAGNNRYLVQVTVSSGVGNRELTETQNFTVQVNKKRSSSTSYSTRNSPPQATGDNYTVPEGGSLTTTRALSVLSNDSDLNQDPITAELITGPQHAGTGFTLNRDGTFTYQHDGSETLSDSFTYQARDRLSSSNTATVTITITPVNDPPLALDQIPPLELLTGESETIISVEGKFFDAEGGPLTHAATSDNEPVITLRWKEGAAISPVQTGEARVTVTATDPEGESASIEFTVTVNQALAFELGNMTVLQVPENAPPGSPVGPALTASGEDSVLECRLFGGGQNHFSVDFSTGQIISGSSLNYEVKDQYGLFVTVHDDQGGSSLIEVTINVTDIEEPPGQPIPPALSASGSGRLNAVWTEPANRGPVITRYELRYKVWFHESWSIDRTEDTESAIPDLGAEERYEVQVRAINDEGEGPWSVSAYGKIAAQTKKLPQEPSPAASSHSSDQSLPSQIVSKIQTNQPILSKDEPSQAVPYQAQTDQPVLSQEEISQPALSSPAPEPELREGVLPPWVIPLMTSAGLITALAVLVRHGWK